MVIKRAGVHPDQHDAVGVVIGEVSQRQSAGGGGNARPPLPLNQERDILIAETAVKNGATLVSDDRNLRKVVSEFGGRGIDALQFEREAVLSRPRGCWRRLMQAV